MTTLVASAKSSVGRKILMALTGLGLFMFVAIHLLGNLTLLMGADAFNGYAHFLEGLAHGMFIYVAEAGLVAFFLLHAVSGVKVWHQKRKARAQGYEVAADAGGASQKSLASKTMVLSGPIILVFVVLHVLHFKYGREYPTTVHGTEMRDLYLLVVEEFQRLPIVLGYVVVMVLVGLHLRHGFWSAFQSLGLSNKRTLPVLTTLSLVCGLLLGFGFIYIPLHIYFFVPDPASASAATVLLSGGGL